MAQTDRDPYRTVVDVVIVEEDLQFSLTELCHACGADPAHVAALVHEGVLDPAGSTPQDWRFSGASLRTARTAWRLSPDLELGHAGTALVLQLLDEIEALRARLQRAHLR
jgi:chaperone modulatory protein CbpM